MLKATNAKITLFNLSYWLSVIFEIKFLPNQVPKSVAIAKKTNKLAYWVKSKETTEANIIILVSCVTAWQTDLVEIISSLLIPFITKKTDSKGPVTATIMPKKLEKKPSRTTIFLLKDLSLFEGKKMVINIKIPAETSNISALKNAKQRLPKYAPKRDKIEK